MSWCVMCGNSGLDINNNPCSCRTNVKSFFDEVTLLDVPEQYRGVKFNSTLLPKDLGESYEKYLQSVYDSILVNKWKCHNALIVSPINHGKTILAYSCMENLFRRGVPTFPLFDVLELKRIIFDMDLCKKQTYDVSDPEELLSVPILFTRIPSLISWEVFDIILTLLDRRVRRGNSTIFLYSGSWSHLQSFDKGNVLQGLMGDGTYNTIEVKYWYANADTSMKFDLPENIG